MNVWLRYALTLFIGLTIGWVAAWFTPPPSPTTLPLRSAPESPLPVFVPPIEPAFTPPVAGPSTLEEILRNPSDFEQTAALYLLGLSATREQLEVLIAEAAELDQVSERRAATSILYGRYAELDPESAVAHILEHGGAFANRWLDSVFHTWSRQDLQSAIERLGELPPHLRTVAGAALLNARDDLPADERRFIAQQLGIEPVMAQLEMQRQIAMTDTDPQEAWRAAFATANQQMRTQQLFRVAVTWANSDPLAAMEAAASVSQLSIRTALQQQIAGVWARDNPTAAIDWALAQPPSSGRGDILSGVLGALATTDPPTAISLAESLSEPDRNKALGGVLKGWASTDPRAAAEWFNLSKDTLSPNVANSVASAYASRYPEEALSWANSLPPASSTMASTIVLSMIGQQDPGRAAELALQLADENTRTNVVQNVLRNWAESDPRAAGRWVARIDDDAQRQPLYASLLRRWSQYDRAGAVQFAQQLRSAADRDAALVGLINSLSDDLPLVEELYTQIQSADQRRLAAARLFYSLRREDPQRAESYRLAAGLDDE